LARLCRAEAALMATQPKSRASVNREANAEVLRDLLARSEHLLRRQAERHAEFSEDAEDALQEALFGAWRGMGGFAGRSSIRTWL